MANPPSTSGGEKKKKKVVIRLWCTNECSSSSVLHASLDVW
jgi:ribosomal protein L44E